MSEAVELTAGRVVHYVLDDGPNKGSVRPAIVVTAGNNGAAGLQVFTHCGHPGGDELAAQLWRDASYDAAGAVGTWHWPPRAPAKGEEPAKGEVKDKSEHKGGHKS